MLRILFFFLVLLVGCNRSTAVKHQAIRINIASDPQTLDPRKSRDLTTSMIVHMLFEGLMRTSKTGELEMALASDVEISETGTQYLFHLRKSFWSNGEPVTSNDFAESWKSILDPSFPSDTAYQLYPIKNGQKVKAGELGIGQLGIQTPDPETLIVELEQPLPYFLELLTLPAFFPVPHKIAKNNPNWVLETSTFVGNGPFVLKEWIRSDSVQIAKNTQYWDAKNIKMEEIDLLMIASDTEIRMFEEGKLDWAGSPLSTIPIDAISDLKTSKKLKINPLSGTYFFRVNTAEKINDKKNPLSNSLFRRALAIAIDRDAITEHVLQGGQLSAKSLVPPEMGLSDNGYFIDSNKELAQSLLIEALLQLDETLQTLNPIVLSYFSNERNGSIAQAVQKQWEEGLGIQVKLEAVEPKTFFKRLSQKEYQVANGSWTADFNDPITFLEVFKYKQASTNNTNWENSKYIDLLNQSALCRDSEERKQILRAAEQVLIDQMPIIPIFHFAMNYLQKEGLEDIALSPIGQVDFRWAHLSNAPL